MSVFDDIDIQRKKLDDELTLPRESLIEMGFRDDGMGFSLRQGVASIYIYYAEKLESHFVSVIVNDVTELVGTPQNMKSLKEMIRDYVSF